MNKKFLSVAFAAFAAFAITACSSDDDNNSSESGNQTVTLVKPVNADKAAEITLVTPLVASLSTTDNKPFLDEIDITEDDRMLFKLTDPSTNKPVYILEKVNQVGNNSYTLNGTKAKGVVTILGASSRTTRASSSISLLVELALVLPDGSTVSFNSPKSDANKNTTTGSGVKTEDYLCRTWSINGATLDLVSTDIKAYKEFFSVNGVFKMAQIREEAILRGVSFTAKEKEDLDREITSITVTNGKKFIISYKNGAEDVATWNWTDSGQTAIKLTMKSSDMGNKFINDNTKLSITFKGNQCNMKMVINFDDSAKKKWDATLMMNLQGK